MATAFSTIIANARVLLNEVIHAIAPIAPIVTPQGTTGATSYSYKIVGLTTAGHTEASTAGSTTTGNAALSATNFNRLTWTTVAWASGYQVWRTVGAATQGLIGTTGAGTATFDDTGLAGDGTTAPTTNTTETATPFWSDAELLVLADGGRHDLWGTMIDLHQDHFMTVDTTNVSVASSTATITGVPSDTFRVLTIEPVDISDTGASRGLIFRPSKYNSAEFIAARARTAIDPTGGGIIYYAIAAAGSPVAAPTIYIAPQLTSVLTLRFVYIPTLAAISNFGNNPIPGESDEAITSWIIAHALAKQREDVSPDPNWIAKYHTEKDRIMISCTPRQEQEPRVMRGPFDEWLGSGLSGGGSGGLSDGW